MSHSKIVRSLALVLFMALGSAAKADGISFGTIFSDQNMDLGVFLSLGDGGMSFGNGGNNNNGGGHHHDHDDGDDGYQGYPETDEDGYGGNGGNGFDLTQEESDQAVASCAKRGKYVFSIVKDSGTYELPGARRRNLLKVNIGWMGMSVICTDIPREGDVQNQQPIDIGGPAILQPRYPVGNGGDDQDQFFGGGFDPGTGGPQLTQPWPQQQMVDPGVNQNFGTTNGLPNVLPPVNSNGGDFNFDVQALQ